MIDRPALLIIGNFLSHSVGTRGVCEDLAERLTKLGWPVITTSNKPERILRLVDMAWTAWSRRNRYQIATIDTYSGNAFFLAELLGCLLKFLRKPYILILHGGDLPNFARLHPRRISRLFKAAAAVTAPSAYLQDQMCAYRADIRLIPNPIDISRYSFRNRCETNPSLIWLRAFHHIYNPALAVRALALLVPHYPNIRLTMIGPDKGDGSLQETKQLAENLGVFQAVEFVGAIPNQHVPAWLDKSDIFINTTNFDNTPVSVMEAMASGMCIASTDVGGITYLLENEENALLVPPKSPEKMADAVHRILADPMFSKKLSNNARLKAEQLDWSVVLPIWENLITKVANA